MTTIDKIRFTLRIQNTLDEKLSKVSADMGISKNAFILMVLSQNFDEKEQRSQVIKAE